MRCETSGPLEAIGLGDKYGATNATIRTPVDIGRLVYGQFLDVIAYGRSLGLDVEFHRGGGVLSIRGYVVTSGEWPATRAFLAALAHLMYDEGIAP